MSLGNSKQTTFESNLCPFKSLFFLVGIKNIYQCHPSPDCLWEGSPTCSSPEHTRQHTFGWSCSFRKIHCICTRVFRELFTFKGQAQRHKTSHFPIHISPAAFCHLLQEQPRGEQKLHATKDISHIAGSTRPTAGEQRAQEGTQSFSPRKN